MNTKEKLNCLVKSPRRFLAYFLIKKPSLSKFISDRGFIKFLFHSLMGYKLDLENPKTFNEKLNWLKLNYKNPICTKWVDKYEAKSLCDNILGGGYTIPTLGIYNSFDEIDLDSLPNQFVLKCTHDCASYIIVKDKEKFDKSAARKKLTKALSNNYFLETREWPYKHVPHRIIAEKFMEDNDTGELRDYKFFCFDGNVEYVYVANDRGSGNVKFDFFDVNFNRLEIAQGHPNSVVLPQKPKTFSEMLEISSKLSQGFPHVRVDLYEINGQVYFGELTFFHFGGLQPFVPDKWDGIFGEKIKLKKYESDMV